jgi:plasmid stabilization system protein ParE
VQELPVEFLEEIEADLREAREFYDSWLVDGRAHFQEKFRETVSWIEWNPELFPRRHRHSRRAVIRRSYYGIYYAIEPTVTTVVAVLDLRQSPAVIRHLLEARPRRK